MKYLAKIQILSSSSLKLIAIITMLIDHIGAALLGPVILRHPAIQQNRELYSLLFDVYDVLRLIGRLAFPIFCFLLVEGFLHTRSKWKYLLRMGLFALISEVPFNLAIYKYTSYANKQNVFFTLFLGLAVMILCDQVIKRKHEYLQFVIMAIGIYLGYLLKTDYGEKGVFMICVLYFLRFSRPIQCLGGACAMTFERGGPFGMIPVLLYNGQKGRMKLKYFFYWFYPVHLLILSGIRYLLVGI